MLSRGASWTTIGGCAFGTDLVSRVSELPLILPIPGISMIGMAVTVSPRDLPVGRIGVASFRGRQQASALAACFGPKLITQIVSNAMSRDSVAKWGEMTVQEIVQLINLRVAQ